MRVRLRACLGRECRHILHQLRRTQREADQPKDITLTDPKSSTAAGTYISIEENLAAPEIFATEGTYFSLTGPNVTVTLTSLRWDNSHQPPVLKRVVVGRLVMPIAAAQSLTVTLYDHLTKHGHEIQRPLDPKQVQ